VTDSGSTEPDPQPTRTAVVGVYAFLGILPFLAAGLFYVSVFAGAELGSAVGACAGVVSAASLLAGLRAVGRIAARITPPLPLPGDIWNLGVPSVKKRSRNWPLRLRLGRATPSTPR
jgi:hypothetical protein